MKKLFFTALVAIVAVGGAFASGPYYLPESSTQIFCEGDISDCATAKSLPVNQPVYTNANTPSGTPGALNLSNIEADLD